MRDKIERPASYYGYEAELWTCIFPGKMGISWKLAWNGYGTKAEADAEAAKHRNSVAVPLALWLRYKEYEHRSVVAEKKLLEETGLRLDYVEQPDEMYGKPTFVQVRPPPTPCCRCVACGHPKSDHGQLSGICTMPACGCGKYRQDEQCQAE